MGRLLRAAASAALVLATACATTPVRMTDHGATPDPGAACSAGSAAACDQLALTLGEAGRPEAAVAQAAAELSHACEGSAPAACVSLGILRELGRGVSVDLAEAVRLFDKACTAGVEAGCYVHAIAAALGLAGLIAIFPPLFDAIRLAGAVSSHVTPKSCRGVGSHAPLTTRSGG